MCTERVQVPTHRYTALRVRTYLGFECKEAIPSALSQETTGLQTYLERQLDVGALEAQKIPGEPST